jgi:hypothetical protein
MRRIATLLVLLGLAAVASGQERIDYGLAAHWTGGVQLEEFPSTPVILDDLILVTDESETVRRIDVSNPYAPQFLSSLTFSEPVGCVLGPLENDVYVAGSEHLLVLDATTLEQIASLDLGGARHLAVGEALGALLTDDGNTLVIVDANQPDTLPVLGTLSSSFSDRDHVAVSEPYVAVSGTFSFSGVSLVDVSNPEAPRWVANFGWHQIPVKRTTRITHLSVRAVATDAIYTIEDYDFWDSSDNSGYSRGYVTRWSLDDPSEPAVAGRGAVLDGHLGGASGHCDLRGDELLMLGGSRIVTVDLQAPALDRSALKTSFLPSAPISGLARRDDSIVVVTADGALHLFRDRQPGGPEAIGGNGGGQLYAALGPGRYAVVTRFQNDYLEWQNSVRVYDTGDPEAPTLLYDHSEYGIPSDSWCAVAVNCAVTCYRGSYGTSRLHSYNVATGAPPTVQGDARDFVFIDAVHGVAAGISGLQIYDTADPDAFILMSHPWTEPLVEVARVTGAPGATTMVAGLDADGSLRLWDVTDPAEPDAVATLAADLDALVDVTGGPARLLMGLRLDRSDWQGATLVLIDCSAADEPVVAGDVRLPGRAYGGALGGPALHLAAGRAGLVVVDVHDPAAPYIRGGLGCDPIHAARIQRDRLLIAGSGLDVVAPDIATPVVHVVTALEIVDEESRVIIRWRLAPGAPRPEFRLRAHTDGSVREFTIIENDGTWTAVDHAPIWGETRYALEHRFAGEYLWSPTIDRIVVRAAPAVPLLLPPVPNPFNPRVSLVCELPSEGVARIRILDVAGRVVRTLIDARLPAGRHAYDWDGRDVNGRKVPSGTYMAELTTTERTDTRKLQLVR